MEPLRYAEEKILDKVNYMVVDSVEATNIAWLDRLPYHLIAPPQCLEIAHMLPRLVILSELSCEQKKSVEEYATSEQMPQLTSAICALLTCSATPTQLALHLEKFLIGSVFNEVILWRYFDPRVFVVCTRVMSRLQLDALLGPISARHFPWLGCWWTLLRKGGMIEPIYAIDHGWPQDTQWQTLNASEVIQRILANHSIYEKGGELTLLNMTIKYVIEAINDRKILDSDDQVAYALLSVRFGRKFHDHWKAASQWSEITAGRSCWTALLAKFTASDFDRMA